MTEQEAIKEHIKECSHRVKTIKRLTKNNHDADMEKCDSNTKILITAIKALKKQIPKKVNARKIMKDFFGAPYTIKGDCPSCGAVGILSANTDYCHCCGQRIDWESEE